MHLSKVLLRGLYSFLGGKTPNLKINSKSSFVASEIAGLRKFCFGFTLCEINP